MSRESVILPDMSTYRIRRDHYRQRRGGETKMLDISCANCEKEVMVYQKDGPGELIRCYLDRIAWPPQLAALQEVSRKQELPNLQCGNCDNVIGTPMLYEPEGRLAYRIVPNSVRKEVYQS